MKEDFLKSVNHRLEILENRLFEREKENDKLKDKIKNLEKKITDQEDENQQLKRDIETSETVAKEKLNDLEQYGRRNSIRIVGINEDDDETAEDTMQKVVDFVNEKIKNVSITKYDIDIAHRIGDKKKGKRQIIAKFVRRTTRLAIIRNRKVLKETGFSIYEDLTSANRLALASIRKKMPDEIDKAWTINGRIIYKNIAGNVHTLQYNEYQRWYDLPWPAASE